jgi:hypothetical protein
MDKHQKRKELIEDIDLDRNDLEAALANANDLWGRYGTTTTVVVLVLAVGFMSWRLYTSWTTSTREAALTELAVEDSPAGFARIANDYGNATVRARALLAGGDTALSEAIRLDATDDDTRTATLGEAESLYQRVLGLNVADVYHVNARLGLASVAESLEDWDQARAHYAAAQEAAGSSLGYLAALATARADRLDEIRQPIPYAAPDPDLDAASPLGDTGFDLPGLDATGSASDDAEASTGFDFDALLDDAAGGIRMPEPEAPLGEPAPATDDGDRP